MESLPYVKFACIFSGGIYLVVCTLKWKPSRVLLKGNEHLVWYHTFKAINIQVNVKVIIGLYLSPKETEWKHHCYYSYTISHSLQFIINMNFQVKNHVSYCYSLFITQRLKLSQICSAHLFWCAHLIFHKSGFPSFFFLLIFKNLFFKRKMDEIYHRSKVKPLIVFRR